MKCVKCHIDKEQSEMYSNIWGITKHCKACFRKNREARLKIKKNRQINFSKKFNAIFYKLVNINATL